MHVTVRAKTEGEPGVRKLSPRSGGRTAARDKNFIALTEKVFAVLETFSRYPQRTLSLEEITQSVGLAKTSVHRLLYSMRKIGYVEQNPGTGNYMLASRFFDLGRAALAYQRLSAIAKPMLENLRLRSGESIHMAVLDKGMIQYIAVVESQNPYRCAAVTGATNYAHSTALGKCLLAYLPEEEVEAIAREQGLPKLARNTITSLVQLFKELERIHQDGYAVNREENIDGVICVAAPIFDASGRPIAALSVSGPAIRMEAMIETARDEVRRVTGALSLSLGYSGTPVSEEAPAVVAG
jgi:IclR family acetate operon transcriptional repressor